MVILRIECPLKNVRDELRTQALPSVYMLGDRFSIKVKNYWQNENVVEMVITGESQDLDSFIKSIGASII